MIQLLRIQQNLLDLITQRRRLKKIRKEKKKWDLKEDPRGGWRRVVPSPDPKDIVEKRIVKRLLQEDSVVITVGGGGIPVIKKGRKYEGVEAVIDKDLASELLAEEVDADKFIILTDVENVMLNYGTSKQQPIEEMTVKQARDYYEQGHFEAGSMGPKVKAGIRFVRCGNGKKCVISHLKDGAKAVKKGAGTLIHA